MFWNIFSKRVISTVRNKDTMIWTWIFPIAMATMFFFTFSSLDTAYELKTIPMGVIQNDAYLSEETFKTTLEEVSKEGENQLFELTYFTEIDTADEQLQEGNISGYIYFDNGPQLIVINDGLEQTITKSFLDSYLQTKGSIERIIKENPSEIPQIPELLESVSYTEEISLTENNPSDKLTYFYALLAMVCLYGCFQGLTSISGLQANLSPLGARRTIAPGNRFKVVLYDLLGGFVVQVGCVTILIAYMTLALGVNFGNNFGFVILTSLMGSLVGIGLGAVISSISKMKEGAKIAILVTVIMVFCFLAGMMTSGINYIVAESAPVIAWINPAARISDAFYCLYYYDNYDRYFLNIGVLLIMSVVTFVISALSIRRQCYESI